MSRAPGPPRFQVGRRMSAGLEREPDWASLSKGPGQLTGQLSKGHHRWHCNVKYIMVYAPCLSIHGCHSYSGILVYPLVRVYEDAIVTLISLDHPWLPVYTGLPPLVRAAVTANTRTCGIATEGMRGPCGYLPLCACVQLGATPTSIAECCPFTFQREW